jgi:hypothetical protein
MVLTMSHWSSGLTCLLPATRVTGSNPLGGSYVKPGSLVSDVSLQIRTFLIGADSVIIFTLYSSFYVYFEIYILHIINDLEFLKISANSLFVVAFCCSKATWEVKVAY